MVQKQFGLSKKEKLKSRKSIDTLFQNGKGFSVFPIRVTYLFIPGEEELKIGVSASKRNFKKAVDRNRIKRLLREVYRLQKLELTEAIKNSGKKGTVFFTYTDKALPTFEAVKTAMTKCLARLQYKINEEPS